MKEGELSPEQVREIRNCDGPTNPNFVLPWDISGKIDRCPVVWFDPDVWQCVGWWADWRVFQSLPFGGSISDQPYVVYQAISVCESTWFDIQRERAPDNG